MIELPIPIQSGRCQKAWTSSSHIETVCFLAWYMCVYLILGSGFKDRYVL